MEHFVFNNSHLPKSIRIATHFLMTLFLTVITLRITTATLDFFRIGSNWLQSNIEIGFMILILIFIVSFLTFDNLLMSITDTGGLLTVFLNSMKDKYDVNEYIENGYHTNFKASNFINRKEVETLDDFTDIDNSNSKKISNMDEPLEEIPMTDKTDDCADQIISTMTLGKSNNQDDL